MMQFCPKCGAILVKKVKNYGCPRCNYSSTDKTKTSSSEDINEKNEIVIVKDDKKEAFPIVPADCPKCGGNEAYFWTIQTRAGDEAETKFFKCTKCKYTWRDYS